MKKYVLGIDVGGTNIKLGIVNPAGKIIFRSALMTRSFVRNKKKFLREIVQFIQTSIKSSKLDRSDLLGIGIGLPGAVNTQKGIVYYLTNIFGWKNVHLKKILEEKLNIPVCIDNDVNVIALGEWKFGAGRGFRDCICITLGTGVGGGLILSGNIYRGASFAAGEIGHIPVNEKGKRCNCGGEGCLETLIGSKYLMKEAEKFFGKKMLLEDVSSLASKGTKKALRFWENVAVHLGVALTSVVNVLNPQCIIIGGGIGKANRFMLKTVKKTVKTRAMKVPGNTVKILSGKLGSDAGIIGAAVLVKSELTSH